ncbi:MAG TPA: antitoxin Xre/MbcA/ParS toxin-binding domain-containing protein [Burkholderiales bacterium]|nr:antitoxin Xre/MbcA/ParS toxin-binding domain-containing protein [Burkholderiales bacterium]
MDIQQSSPQVPWLTNSEVARQAAEVLGMDAASTPETFGQALPDVDAEAFSRLADRIAVPVAALAGACGLRETQILIRAGRIGSLGVQESDHLFRIAYVAVLAARVLNDWQQSGEWLTTAQHGLSDRVPLDCLNTNEGTEKVTSLLMRLEQGFFA